MTFDVVSRRVRKFEPQSGKFIQSTCTSVAVCHEYQKNKLFYLSEKTSAFHATSTKILEIVGGWLDGKEKQMEMLSWNVFWYDKHQINTPDERGERARGENSSWDSGDLWTWISSCSIFHQLRLIRNIFTSFKGSSNPSSRWQNIHLLDPRESLDKTLFDWNPNRLEFDVNAKAIIMNISAWQPN